jgi:hypothetical protein
MKTAKRTSDDLTCVIRGFALAVGLLANIPFALFLIDSGAKVCPALSWSSPQGMPLFVVLTMAMLGYLIAWRWERIGGAMAIVSSVAICALVILGPDRTPILAALMISLPLFVAGILFLACNWRTGQERLWQGS